MASRLEWNADTDPAQRAARVVALGALDDVMNAEEGVVKRDPESVHKFRVSLRQLRSWLRVYRPWLDDTLRKRTGRRLRRIARATTELRDLDVQIEWLRAERMALGDSRLAAAKWIRSTLRTDRKKAWRRFRKVRTLEFVKATSSLQDDLAHYIVKRDIRRVGEDDRMGPVSAQRLRDQSDALEVAFGRVRSADDTVRLHRARIIAKQTRYNLQLLGPHVPEISALTDDLSRFQDLVGELRDAQLLAHRVSREITRIAAQRTALVASELVYRPTGATNFLRVITSSPFDTSLALLFARLHDRIAAASRMMVSWLESDAAARIVSDIRAAAARLDQTG
jgi:CHAD domain-containing protein